MIDKWYELKKDINIKKSYLYLRDALKVKKDASGRGRKSIIGK